MTSNNPGRSTRTARDDCDDQDDVADLFRSFGWHSSQRETALRVCKEEHLVLTVGDLRMLIGQDVNNLTELFPQLGLRARIQAWYENHQNANARTAAGTDAAAAAPAAAAVAPTNIPPDLDQQITVRVKYLSCRSIFCDVRLSDSVLRLKQMIQDQVGTPPDNCELLFCKNGTVKKLRPQNQTLAFFGMEQDDRIDMIPIMWPGMVVAN